MKNFFLVYNWLHEEIIKGENMSIKVYGEKVLVEKIDSSIGLLVPDMSGKVQQGIVMYVGDLPENYDIKKGDKILFQTGSWQNNLRVENKFLEIVEKKDIVAKIGEN